MRRRNYGFDGRRDSNSPVPVENQNPFEQDKDKGDGPRAGAAGQGGGQEILESLTISHILP